MNQGVILWRSSWKEKNQKWRREMDEDEIPSRSLHLNELTLPSCPNPIWSKGIQRWGWWPLQRWRDQEVMGWDSRWRTENDFLIRNICVPRAGLSAWERILHPVFLQSVSCPGWCGSVDWVVACKPGGCWFNSTSEHIPGLGARSLVGVVWEATNQYFSRSLSLSLPSL